MPKRQPPLPFLDLWFTCYSSSLPQLPWQQHTLGPAGKIPHSDLAPVPHGRQAWTAGEKHRHDELDIERMGATVESLAMTVAWRAGLGRWLLFFLLLAINPSAPGWPQLGRLTLWWFLMVYVPTARQAWALPTQPPQRIPSLGMRGAIPNPSKLEGIHSSPLHAATVNSGQPRQKSRGAACLCGKYYSTLGNLRHEGKFGHGRAAVPKLIKMVQNLTLSYAWLHQCSGWQMSFHLNHSSGEDA